MNAWEQDEEIPHLLPAGSRGWAKGSNDPKRPSLTRVELLRLISKRHPSTKEPKPPKLRQRLYAACGGLCHLCGLPLPKLCAPRTSKADDGISLDHLVPRSQGGKDRPNNVALAHRYCNSIRGSRELTTELREEIAKLARARFAR